MSDKEQTAEPQAFEQDAGLGIAAHEKVCGNCRLFKPVMKDGISSLWYGDCRVQPDRGMFPVTAATCSSYMPRSAPIPRTLKPAPSSRERRPIAPVLRAPPVDVPIPELEDMTREELKQIIREALTETDVRLAPKWEGGTVVIKPADPDLQPRELPVDALFHKVVMVRDRLRVLEQKVNSNPRLSDAEKLEMQQYVTRCYGSLTSFNLLFADREDGFVGDKSKD